MNKYLLYPAAARRHPMLALTAAALALGCTSALHGGVDFTDDFTEFALGDRWQAHGAGVPDVALSVVAGLGADGSSLRMGTAPGTAGEITGIETSAAFPLAGASSIRVTVRLRPLNQTATGEGGASDAAAGLTIVGASGAFARVSAGANRPSPPDWGDFYADSEGSADANAAFLHFPPNDPDGGAEAFRTFVLEIGPDGTSLTTLSSAGDPLILTAFNVQNPNLTLAGFGNSFTVALFQERSDSTLAPENGFGDIDSVVVESVRATDDTDGDGMPNAYETANGLNPDANDAALDLDGDGLSNLAEFQRGTGANVADTDGDGLRDSVESGSGVYVSGGDTGTSPLKADSDNDGLGDGAETGTGLFVSATSTGSNPNQADSDQDGFSDGVEVDAGFNPNSMDSTPAGATTIATAVELKFYAAPGTSYRIEASADLAVWSVIEASIPGAGNRISRLYSTDGKPYRYFRAEPN